MNDEQCRGTTKSGTRCRIRVGLVDGYCSRHRDQDQAGRTTPEEKKSVNTPGEQAFPEPAPLEPEAVEESSMPRWEDNESGHEAPCECRCAGTWMRNMLPVTALLGLIIALLWRSSRRRFG